MARQYKRVFKPFAVWNYREEVEYLNDASAKGWQLVRSTFGTKFKWNPDVRYCYQTDYTGKIEDMGRYLETFREQGWEYVSSCKGWHYFRKPYDPTLPESEYEIFTDRDSLNERNSRWIKRMAIVAALIGLIAVAMLVRFLLAPQIPAFIQLAVCAVDLLFLLFGMHAMKKAEKRTSPRMGRAIIATVVLLGIVGGITVAKLTETRGFFQCNYSSEETGALPADLENALEWTGIEFAYTDNYYLDLDIQAESPVRFTIQNEAGDVVYEAVGADVSLENIKLKLLAGEYSVKFSDFSGGELNVYLNID